MFYRSMPSAWGVHLRLVIWFHNGGVIPEKLTHSQLVKKFLAFCETRKFFPNFTRTHSFFRIVSQFIQFCALAFNSVRPVLLLVSDLRVGHRMITDWWIGWRIWEVGVLSQRWYIIKKGLRKPLNHVRTVFYAWSVNRVLPVQYVKQTTT